MSAFDPARVPLSLYVHVPWCVRKCPYCDFNSHPLAGEVPEAEFLAAVEADHAAEAVTGFYTKYGDGGADVLPLAGLTKRQGKQILQALQVPEVFTTKAPTADLLDGTPGQADETELGIPYDMLDDYLEGKEIDPATAEAIERRYAATQHKREMPVAF